jgi:cystathionine beta-lyase
MTDSSNNAPDRDLQTRIVQPEDRITPGFESC